MQLAKIPVENDGSILTVDQPYSEEEGEDASKKLMDIPTLTPEQTQPFEAYQVPVPMPEGDPAETIVEIHIPFDQLHSVLKSYDSTPAIFLESLFSRSISLQYGGTANDKNIIAAIPVNLRPFFHSVTTKYFIAVPVLSHSHISFSNNFSEILQEQKEILSRQLTTEHIASLIQQQAKGLGMIMSMPNSVEEKFAFMKYGIEMALKSFTYIFTNMGVFDLPESMAPYVTKFIPVVPTATLAYTIACATFNGELVLSVAQRDEDTSVCRRFVEALQEEFKVSATISSVYKFHTLKYNPS